MVKLDHSFVMSLFIQKMQSCGTQFVSDTLLQMSSMRRLYKVAISLLFTEIVPCTSPLTFIQGLTRLWFSQVITKKAILSLSWSAYLQRVSLSTLECFENGELSFLWIILHSSPEMNFYQKVGVFVVNKDNVVNALQTKLCWLMVKIE